MYATAEFLGEIGTIEHTTDQISLRAKSRDRYAVSPLLKTMLAGKHADVVVSPCNKEELIRVVAAAAKYRIPIT